MEKYFRFGQVLKPQGIKGELKLKTFTDDLSRVGDIDHIYLKKAMNTKDAACPEQERISSLCI